MAKQALTFGTFKYWIFLIKSELNTLGYDGEVDENIIKEYYDVNKSPEEAAKLYFEHIKKEDDGYLEEYND